MREPDYTPAEIRKICELSQVTYLERIAAQVGRTSNSVRKKLSQQGIRPKTRTAWLLARREATVVRLHHQGWTPTEIGVELHIKSATVHKILRNPPEVKLLDPRKLLNHVFKELT